MLTHSQLRTLRDLLDQLSQDDRLMPSELVAIARVVAAAGGLRLMDDAYANAERPWIQQALPITG